MKTLMQQGVLKVLLLAAVLVLIPHSWAQQTVEARKVSVKVPPVYPTVARNMHIHGVVRVEAQVAPNGSVKAVEVKGGHPMLAQAAVTAVGHWKFEPAAHESTEVIEIKFDQE